MMITGSPLAPVGGGTPWALCGASDGTTPSCQNAGLPGAEQYFLRAITLNDSVGVTLSQQPQCDIVFGAGNCQAPPGRATVEGFHLYGAESTANGASDYTTTVTWTVVP
jgi:hypothetical protein